MLLIHLKNSENYIRFFLKFFLFFHFLSKRTDAPSSPLSFLSVWIFPGRLKRYINLQYLASN